MRRKPLFNSWIGSLSFLIILLASMNWIADQLDLIGDKIDQRDYPWGYASSGRPTLTGTWVGPLVINSGQRFGMLVEMKLTPPGGGRPAGKSMGTRWLDGRVLLCARPGQVQSFLAWGAPEDAKKASRFLLAFSQAGSVLLDDLWPSRLRGQWGGKDSITLLGALHMPRAKSAIAGPSYPDAIAKTPVTLVRGTEADFNSLCNRLPTQITG
jgi:hypothetical protein